MRIFVALPMQADRCQQLADTRKWASSTGLRPRPKATFCSTVRCRTARSPERPCRCAAFPAPDALTGAADHFATQTDFAAGDFFETGDAAQQGRSLPQPDGPSRQAMLAAGERKSTPSTMVCFSVALNDAI